MNERYCVYFFTLHTSLSYAQNRGTNKPSKINFKLSWLSTWGKLSLFWAKEAFTHPSWIKSSNGNIFRVTGHCAGKSSVIVEFPAQRPVTRSFDFFYLHLYKRFSKQSRGWWFETQSHPLWRHCNDNNVTHILNLLMPRIIHPVIAFVVGIGNFTPLPGLVHTQWQWRNPEE